MLGKTALAVLLFSVFRLTPAVQQGGSHSAAAGHQIKAFLVDTPLEQHTAVERHQLGHQLLPVPLGRGAALLLAGGGQLPQDAEVHYYYGRSLGEAGKVFDAYLHLAYSSLYQNDKRKTESWLKQVRPLARTPVEQDQLKRFEAIYAERQEVWK